MIRLAGASLVPEHGVSIEALEGNPLFGSRGKTSISVMRTVKPQASPADSPGRRSAPRGCRRSEAGPTRWWPPMRPRTGAPVRDRPDTPVDPDEPETLHGSEDVVHRLRRAGRVALWCLAAVALLVSAWILLVRPWHLRWGATDEELRRSMPGDEVVPEPQHASTRAVTVAARPEEIWPWLAQMGKGRGGLYSIDWLDQLFGVLDEPSAERILPQFQDLRAGDVIPVGGMPGWPVALAEPNRLLLIEVHQDGFDVTQSWGLYPAGPEATRLVLRVRGRGPPGPRTRLLLAALDPQEFLMVRAQLRGIQRRAEAVAAQRRAGVPSPAALVPGGPAPRAAPPAGTRQGAGSSE